jgi:hypothetical protein
MTTQYLCNQYLQTFVSIHNHAIFLQPLPTNIPVSSQPSNICATITYKHSFPFTTMHIPLPVSNSNLLTLACILSPQAVHWATGMNYYFVLIVLIELIQFCSCEMKSLKRQKVISRKKRYLAFPEGSSIVVSNLLGRTFVMLLLEWYCNIIEQSAICN